MAEPAAPAVALGATNAVTPKTWRLPTGTRAILWSVASALLALGLWVAIILVVKPKAFVLPAPWDVLARAFADREALAFHGLSTIGEILAGFVIGAGVAIPLGILIVAVPVFERLVYPILVAFNSIPKVALAPLFVVWFGYGLLPRVLVSVSITFFPILVATVSGLVSADPDILQFARSVRASRARIFMHVRLPSALPSIFSGLKVATSLAVIGAIIGEFVASDRGWGWQLMQASGQLDTTLMFAIVVLLAVFASLLFGAVGLVERLVISWHASQRKR